MKKENKTALSTDFVSILCKTRRMNLHKIFLIFFSLFPALCFAQLQGKVVSVADGDTITVLTDEKKQIKVRLAEIDAPERGQAYGQRSRETLSTLVAGKGVTVNETDTDRYKRVLGFVLIDGINVNYEMVRQGMAWCYTQYLARDSICPPIEKEARGSHRGLWAEKEPTPPWEFRKRKRSG